MARLRRYKRNKPEIKDFISLALMMKMMGGILLFIGLVLFIITPESPIDLQSILVEFMPWYNKLMFQDLLKWNNQIIWSMLTLGPGLLPLLCGIALERYKAWAWALTVYLMVPASVFGSLVITGFFLHMADSVLSLILCLIFFCALPIMGAVYVCWVLFSEEGRARYKRLVIIKARKKKKTF